MVRNKFTLRNLAVNPALLFTLALIFVLYVVVEKDNTGKQLDYLENRSPALGSLTLNTSAKIDDWNGVTPIHLTGQENNYSAFEKVREEDNEGLLFVDRTLESGIDFYHAQGGKMLNAISEVIGAGVCTADVDRDGFLDIYLVNGTGYTHFYGKKWWWYKTPYNTLYHNNGDGTFLDGTEKSKTGDQKWGMGCAFGDYDNDGYPDLYVTNYGANTLYHNNGDGSFTDITEKAGVGDKGWGTSVAWGDYDNDGDLDLYVANYVVFDKTMNPGEPNSAFKTNMPLLMNSKLFDGQRNILYKNNGDGTFEDVTDQAGAGNSPGKSMGVTFLDYNNDGFQDIYITNDSSRNVLYKNNHDGTFTDTGGVTGTDSPLSSMGVAAADYDNDGDIDIFSTYGQADTNTLYENLLITKPDHKNYRENQFSNITVDAGLGEESSIGYMGWGTAFIDFDHDGYQDIFVTNGHGMPDFDNPQTTVPQKNKIFRNSSKGTFRDISSSVGEALRNINSGRGTAFGDFDNDGDTDLIIINNNGFAALIKNESQLSNSWITIKLTGKKSNRDGIGAKVRVKTGDLVQLREVRSGSGYLSQNDIRLNVGLKDSKKIDSIEITWPDGAVQSLFDVEVNRFINITEGESEIQIVNNPLKPSTRGPRLVNKKNKNPKIRIEAIRSIAKLEDERGLDLLKNLLDDPDPNIRKETVKAMAALGVARGVRALLILLKNEKDPTVRLEVIKGLKYFESERIIPPLIAALESDSMDLKRAASESLAFILEKEQTIFRSTILKKRMAVAPLIKALKEKDSEVRMYSVKGLGFSESYRAVMPVIAMFKDPAPKVKEAAVLASGLLRDKRAIEPLLELVKTYSEEAGIRATTVITLKKLESNITCEPLLEIARYGKTDSKEKALSTLNALFQKEESILLDKEKINRYLKEGIKDQDAEIRLGVIQLAETLHSEESVAVILRALSDSSLEVRQRAAKASNNLEAPELRTALRKFMRDKDSALKEAAITSLAKGSGKRSDIKYLNKILIRQSQDSPLYQAAFRTLLKIKPEKAINRIKKTIAEANPKQRLKYIKLLGAAKSKNAMDLLLKYLEDDEDINTRIGAVRSLKRFAKERKVVLALSTLLTDKSNSYKLRRESLSLLQSSPSMLAYPPIVRIINDNSDELGFYALDNIHESRNRNNSNMLMNLIRNRRNGTDLRAKAVSALGKLKDPKIYDLLSSFI